MFYCFFYNILGNIFIFFLSPQWSKCQNKTYWSATASQITKYLGQLFQYFGFVWRTIYLNSQPDCPAVKCFHFGIQVKFNTIKKNSRCSILSMWLSIYSSVTSSVQWDWLLAVEMMGKNGLIDNQLPVQNDAQSVHALDLGVQKSSLVERGCCSIFIHSLPLSSFCFFQQSHLISNLQNLTYYFDTKNAVAWKISMDIPVELQSCSYCEITYFRVGFIFAILARVLWSQK
jgi:hypothetical protein